MDSAGGISGEKTQLPGRELSVGCLHMNVVVMLRTFGFNPDEVLSHSRLSENKNVRFAVFYVLKTDFDISYMAIGRAFGFNHAAVIHAVRQTTKMMFQRNLFIKKLTGLFHKYIEENCYG